MTPARQPARAMRRGTRNGKFDDGGAQFLCPVCAVRVTTNAKTHDPTLNEAAPFLHTRSVR